MMEMPKNSLDSGAAIRRGKMRRRKIISVVISEPLAD